MNKISKELNKIKYVVFGKVKNSQKPKVNDKIKQLQTVKYKCFDETVDEELGEEKVEEIYKEISEHLLKRIIFILYYGRVTQDVKRTVKTV